MKRKPRKRMAAPPAAGLGFQVQQPTKLQFHLFRAEYMLNQGLDKLAKCTGQLMRSGLNGQDAKMLSSLVVDFCTAGEEMRLAQSAAATHA